MKRGRTPRKHVAKDGTESWKVRYRSATGTEKSETFYDEDAAVEFADLVKAIGAVRALVYIDERAKAGGDRDRALTVDDIYAKWIEFKSARNKAGKLREVRSERTVVDYARKYAARIKPEFGSTPANLISPVEVQLWIDHLGDELAPKTVADYHSLLHQIYTWAIHPTRGLVINDPCTETKLPKRRKKQPKGLHPAEWAILYAAAQETDADCADLLLGFVSTGWRWSELVAVQALAVDHWIDGAGVSRTFLNMGRVLRREGNTYEYVDDAKSAAGLRRVRITGPGEEMVLRRIEGKRPTDLIFTNKHGHRWHYISFHTRYWDRPKGRDYAKKRIRILERARKMGLDQPELTPHWLRHTHVGMLILAGEPLTAIQRRLGHASIKTTSDTYGRMIEDASDAGLDRVAAMISGKRLPLSIDR